MNDIVVKREKEDIDDLEACLPDITKLLEIVKREQSNEDELPADPEEILKNLTNDQSSDSADDADIQKLQELLKDKLEELEKSDEKQENKSRRKSRSSGSPECTSARKKRIKDRKRKAEKDAIPRRDDKRNKDNTSETESSVNENRISINLSVPNDDIPWTKQEESASSIQMERLPTEEELENILQTQIYSDEEPCSSNQINNAVSPEQGVGVSTSSIQFELESNPPTEFHDSYNPDPSLDAAHYTEHFPVPEEEEEELQCLPVVNSAGFCGIPMFKRIKLEKTVVDHNEENDNTTDETPEEKRNKIFNTCMALLEKLEFSEPSGKFIFTPTITKKDCSAQGNSILQKISNVHYDFQSIGPKLNLTDWGLKAIGSANGKVAKAIGISADAYYSKIKQKSDTLAGKLIKVKTDKDEESNEKEMENEEPTLSTFFKSSLTQTDPLVCQRCVARSRIVGHDVGVQARVHASSFGTQTYSHAEDHSDVTAGLSENQIKALYDFSHLMRDLSMNPSIEMFQTRAMDIYNSIQNEREIHCSPYRNRHENRHREPSHEHPDQRRIVTPNVVSYPAHVPQSAQMLRESRDPRSYHERSNTRPVPAAEVLNSPHIPPVQSYHSANHKNPYTSSRDPRSRDSSPPKAFWNPHPPDNFANYQPHGMPRPSHHSPNGEFPGHPPTVYGYPPAAKDSRVSYGRGHRP